MLAARSGNYNVVTWAQAVINCLLIGNNWLAYIFSTLDPTDPSFMAVFPVVLAGKTPVFTRAA